MDVMEPVGKGGKERKRKGACEYVCVCVCVCVCVRERKGGWTGRAGRGGGEGGDSARVRGEAGRGNIELCNQSGVRNHL